VVTGDQPRFWEGFTPAALTRQPAQWAVRTVFCVEGDWRRAEVQVTQAGAIARMVVADDGDLAAAAAQASRFLALDVDCRGWPQVAHRDPVIADAQTRLPGLRPYGFHSPVRGSGVVGAVPEAADQPGRPAPRRADHSPWRRRRVPAPLTVRGLDLDLPCRKKEYLHAVAEAALDGL
jgi:DNA-3-methyladenine glycosylase II